MNGAADIAINPEDAFRRRLARWLAGYMVVFITSATIIRPVFVDMSITFTYLGLFNAGVATLIYTALVKEIYSRYAPVALCFLGAGLLVPLMLLSGGVNSQFTPLIPLLPIFCALIAGRKTAVWVAILLSALIALMTIFAAAVPDLSGERHHEAKSISRGIWLGLSTVMGTTFSWQFDMALSRLQKKLRAQATRDPLTGLANRRALDEFLEQQVARAEREGGETSLLMIDVDHFKQYNDRYGHAAGDECLQSVARVIESNTRYGQDLAARFGGEEFVVVLTNTSSAQAQRAAEHLRQAIEELPRIEPGSAPITVTIGAASASACCPTETFIQIADEALYDGKRGGRNRVVVAAV